MKLKSITSIRSSIYDSNKGQVAVKVLEAVITNKDNIDILTVIHENAEDEEEEE